MCLRIALILSGRVRNRLGKHERSHPGIRGGNPTLHRSRRVDQLPRRAFCWQWRICMQETVRAIQLFSPNASIVWDDPDSMSYASSAIDLASDNPQRAATMLGVVDCTCRRWRRSKHQQGTPTTYARGTPPDARGDNLAGSQSPRTWDDSRPGPRSHHRTHRSRSELK
jgi:hypothetical protein